MRPELLDLLRCPHSGSRLTLDVAREVDGRVLEGTLVAVDGGARYPVRGGIPRFVPPDNYADNFGLQWNRFRATQLDSHSGHPISRDRFYRFTGWTPDALRGKRVLDVGCGAGRFAEIALDAGAHVVAMDFSSACDACAANHAGRDTLDVLQANVYALPFAPGSFDFVYCLGVLQHTPDVRAAFMALPLMLRPGGALAIDLYPRLWRNLLWPKYWLRPMTRRLPRPQLLALVERMVPVLLPVSRVLGRVPGIGRQLRHVVPVSNYEGILPLDERQLHEWGVLDTFDMLSPEHDHPQTAATLSTWMHHAGLEAVHVERMGFLVGRGRAPGRA